ncbi:Ppx/GppA phosphatase family protein [Candidatus Berkiella aquae]|uniref:Guanosine pentaphosphate phosphohydrolase n=1 Tax=Candidatus Berkiella aquae TaxID=295108 RepID=A0A0Q9YV07_9GAMM|nr:hypothetical protein [Candidatus Berkiella aquae]MCS5712258.1 hypothetical protein [Candidatus Berkiella aquae]
MLNPSFEIKTGSTETAAAGAAEPITKIAYDIGSGGIKTTVISKILQKDGNVEEVVLDKRLPIQFARNLRLNKGQFSPDIVKLAIDSLKAFISEICNSSSDQKIEHYAVATAAFRQAENGKEVVQEISEAVGFPIDIISYKQEGLLAYYSAKTKLSEDKIIFDLGGGSMQFVYKSPDDALQIAGIDLGVETFTGELQKSLNNSTVSLNPFSEEKYQLAQNVAMKLIDQSIADMGSLKSLIKENLPVMCVGAVHNVAIYPIIEKIVGAGVSYSADNLEKTIMALLDKSDEELLAVEENINFAQILLPTLILSLAMMQRLGISQMQPLNVSNTLGLLQDIPVPFLSPARDLKKYC